MVELIVVMVLIGILGAVGVARFFDRAGFDADAFTEQTRSMLRYGQKVAIAQRRAVFVHLDPGRVWLCFSNVAPCPPTAQVPAPSGGNSATGATAQNCTPATWYCEGTPAGISYTLSPEATFAGANSYLSFDALGRPYGPTPGADFPGLAITIQGDGQVRTVSVALETGYVH
jgi:MSHA pilin protein MshC